MELNILILLMPVNNCVHIPLSAAPYHIPLKRYQKKLL